MWSSFFALFDLLSSDNLLSSGGVGALEISGSVLKTKLILLFDLFRILSMLILSLL